MLSRLTRFFVWASPLNDFSVVLILYATSRTQTNTHAHALKLHASRYACVCLHVFVHTLVGAYVHVRSSVKLQAFV